MEKEFEHRGGVTFRGHWVIFRTENPDSLFLILKKKNDFTTHFFVNVIALKKKKKRVAKSPALKNSGKSNKARTNERVRPLLPSINTRSRHLNYWSSLKPQDMEGTRSNIKSGDLLKKIKGSISNASINTPRNQSSTFTPFNHELWMSMSTMLLFRCILLLFVGITRSILQDVCSGRSPSLYIDRFRNYCTDATGNWFEFSFVFLDVRLPFLLLVILLPL